MGLGTGNFRLQKRGYLGLSVSGVLQREEYDIDALFFPTSGLTLSLCLLTCFYTFGLPSFICCSRLHLSLIYMMPFTYVRCHLLVLFVTLTTCFCVLQSCISSKTMGQLFIAVGSPVPSLFPVLWHPLSVLPLHYKLCLQFSALALSLYYSILQHYLSHKYLIIHGITACYCYLYETIVVSCKDK